MASDKIGTHVTEKKTSSLKWQRRQNMNEKMCPVMRNLKVKRQTHYHVNFFTTSLPREVINHSNAEKTNFKVLQTTTHNDGQAYDIVTLPSP